MNRTRRPPGKQYGAIIPGSSDGTEVTVGEGGVGHDEAIVPLGNGGLGGGADPATRDNTLVTLENTAAINRLVAIMRPISERAATARASIEGAFPGHYQGEGGTGGGYERQLRR